MKKLFSFTAVIALTILCLTSCGEKKQQENSTIAQILSDQFEILAKTENDSEKIAAALSTNPCLETGIVCEDITGSQFLSGFRSEIKNYKKGYMIAPVIGSIPFVAYVFESDDTKALTDELYANFDMRWNICVEAEEMSCVKTARLVFFVMSPCFFEN